MPIIPNQRSDSPLSTTVDLSNGPRTEESMSHTGTASTLPPHLKFIQSKLYSRLDVHASKLTEPLRSTAKSAIASSKTDRSSKAALSAVGTAFGPAKTLDQTALQYVEALEDIQDGREPKFSLGELSHIETQEMETESEKARAEFNESVNNLYTAATVLAGVTAFGLVSRMFSDPK